MFGLNHILLSMEKGVFRVVSHHDLTCDQAKSRKLPTIMERSLCLLAPALFMQMSNNICIYSIL